jgi:hypothetical protein
MVCGEEITRKQAGVVLTRPNDRARYVVHEGDCADDIRKQFNCPAIERKIINGRLQKKYGQNPKPLS